MCDIFGMFKEVYNVDVVVLISGGGIYGMEVVVC